MTIKSRSYRTFSLRSQTNELRQGLNLITSPASPRNADYYGFEELVSEGHIWPPRKGDHTNSGGAFRMRRIEQAVQPASAEGRAWIGTPGPTTPNYYFLGTLVPNGATTAVYAKANLSSPVSDGGMNAQGTKGWARFKPTASRGGLDQAIGEIHQVPSLYTVKRLREAMLNMRHNQGWGRALSKATGENYLNYVFGWVPLISDLIDLVDNSYKLEARMRQLLKDNDKPVRRRGTIDSSGGVTSVNVTSAPGGGLTYPSLASPLYGIPEVEYRTQTSTLKYWFAGRFRYHIVDPRPYNDGKILSIKPREAYQLQRILLGGEFTPETLYNITPWTWLLDWVVPMGDIVNNFVNDQVDGLVADYAYTMAHTHVLDERRVTGRLTNGSSYQTTSVKTTEVKQRNGASPYGFGLSFSSFSVKQMAILAALGFTKLQ